MEPGKTARGRPGIWADIQGGWSAEEWPERGVGGCRQGLWLARLCVWTLLCKHPGGFKFRGVAWLKSVGISFPPPPWPVTAGFLPELSRSES